MRIVLGANLAEGKYMFSHLLDMNIILLKKKIPIQLKLIGELDWNSLDHDLKMLSYFRKILSHVLVTCRFFFTRAVC